MIVLLCEYYETPMIDEEKAADLFIEFGRSHGAFSMVRGERPIIDDHDAAVDFMLTDDTGMDSYDHSAVLRNFPLSLYFKGRSASEIAESLKAHLDGNGFATEPAPQPLPNGNLRVMPSVFVWQKGQDVEVTVHDLN